MTTSETGAGALNAVYATRYVRERRMRRPPIDWTAVECDYRSGALSLRDMALKHNCSHSAIASAAAAGALVDQSAAAMYSISG
jgi:hypothetical protein